MTLAPTPSVFSPNDGASTEADVNFDDQLRGLSCDETENVITFFKSGPVKFTYNLKPNKLTTFWTLYCQAIQAGENPWLSEKTPAVIPTIFIFNFRFSNDVEELTPDHLHHAEFIEHLVLLLNRIMLENFETSIRREELLTVVASSIPYLQDDRIHYRLRIQFPYARTELSAQRRMRTTVIDSLYSSGIIRDFHLQPLDAWEQILDSSYWEAVPLIGSVNRSDEEPTELHSIWMLNEDETVTSGVVLEQVFQPALHAHVNARYISAELFKTEPPSHWIPFFLSVHYNYAGQLAERMREEVPTIRTTSAQSNSSVSTQAFEIAEENHLQMAKRFLEMINPHRLKETNYWRTIGQALWACCDGDPEGCHLWRRFTEASGSPLVRKCEEEYYQFRDPIYDIRTLAWYAQEDNPELYTKWHKQWYAPYYEEAATVKCPEGRVAKAFYRQYWLNIVYAPKKWYIYNKDRHRHIPDDGLKIRRMISEDFAKRLEKWRTGLCAQAEHCPLGSDKRNFIEMKIKGFQTLIEKLCTGPYKTRLIKELEEIFYDEYFLSRLNKGDRFLGLRNGVLEAGDKGMIFRPGKPQDYITMTTNICYYPCYRWDNPQVQETLRWLNQLFPYEDLRDFALKVFSLFLRARNVEKKFLVFSGGTNGGKSMFKKLLEATLGDYVTTLETTLITGKRAASSGATPELAAISGCHLVLVQEPDDEEPIKKGIVKGHTGGDRYWQRGLYQSGGVAEAFHTLGMICNTIPNIPNADEAIMDRFLLICFLSQYRKDAPDDPAEQERLHIFKRDPYFEDKIGLLAPAFLWILFQYYARYLNEGIVPPAVVTDITAKYWQNNDPYNMFMEEQLAKAFIPGTELIDRNVTLTHTTLFQCFKMWYRSNFPGVREIPNTSVVKNEFIRRLGPQTARKWIGWRLTSQEPDV